MGGLGNTKFGYFSSCLNFLNKFWAKMGRLLPDPANLLFAQLNELFDMIFIVGKSLFVGQIGKPCSFV